MRTPLLVLVLALVAVMAACASDGDAPTEPADATASAVDGEWTLDFLVLEGDMAIVIPEPIHLRIDGTEFGGSAGCNSLGGVATFADDGTVTIAELFQTSMACEDRSLMDFENDYSRALNSVSNWRLDGDMLVLEGNANTVQFTPRVAPPDKPLDGTIWTLDTFFDGDVAMNSVDMAAVTVTFGADTVSMRGRCWSMESNATIEPGGAGNLRVDIDLSDPDFTCEDEGLFSEMTERMASVSEYEIDEGRLTLGDGGTPIVGFHAG